MNKRGLHSDLVTLAINNAIALIRSIGIRYSWVDSLCICNQTDWCVGKLGAGLSHLYTCSDSSSIQNDTDSRSPKYNHIHMAYRNAFISFYDLNSDICNEIQLERALLVRIPFQFTIQPDINNSIEFFSLILKLRIDGLHKI